tara:strand:+ start:2680 stop:2937 length:258 start_codon:yes stop_codon:yes gene_type:complete
VIGIDLKIKHITARKTQNVSRINLSKNKRLSMLIFSKPYTSLTIEALMAEEYIIEEIIKTLTNNMEITIQKISLMRMQASIMITS